MQGAAIQAIRRGHPAAQGIEALEQRVLLAAAALGLAFITGQLLEKTLDQS
ncbi:MAG: LEPR-XLL domain-containing protein [Cyanobium sp.]